MSRKRKERAAIAAVPAAPRKTVAKSMGVIAGDRPGEAASLDDRLREALREDAQALTSDDAHEMERCRRLLMSLLTIGPLVETIPAMTRLRQAYAMVYHDLLDRVDHLKQRVVERGLGAWPAGFADFVSQFVTYQAGQPFDVTNLLGQVAQDVWPVLTEITNLRRETETAAAHADRLVEDTARRERPVNLGFEPAPTVERGMLDRRTSVVLVGWAPVVLYYLQKAWDQAGDVRIRLTALAAGLGPLGVDRLWVAGNKWQACAASPRLLAMMMGDQIADKLSAQPDLLICDSLPYAWADGRWARPAGAKAGDAHRIFRRWCDATGCGFLGGVPLATLVEAPDLMTPEFDQLRAFTTLIALNVTADDTGERPGFRVRFGHNIVDFVYADDLKPFGGTL